MIKIGNLDISKLYIGETEIGKVYLGDVQVYMNREEDDCFYVASVDNDIWLELTDPAFAKKIGNTYEFSDDNKQTWTPMENMVHMGDESGEDFDAHQYYNEHSNSLFIKISTSQLEGLEEDVIRYKFGQFEEYKIIYPKFRSADNEYTYYEVEDYDGQGELYIQKHRSYPYTSARFRLDGFPDTRVCYWTNIEASMDEYATDIDTMDDYIHTISYEIDSLYMEQNKRLYIRYKQDLEQGDLVDRDSSTAILRCGQSFNIGGDIKSLTNYNDEYLYGKKPYAYMFNDCDSLVDASNLLLPNWISDGGFKGMFKGCSLLTKAPQIELEYIPDEGCSSMFTNCTSLTKSPKIKVSSVGRLGCKEMFLYCYNLVSADSISVDHLSGTQQFHSMFRGCSALTQAPQLPATTLASSCYDSMFYGCTSLTSAPELPATTLAQGCYYNMFYNCRSLTSVTHHITNWNTTSAGSWLQGVAASGTVTCPADSTIPSDNTSGIPTGWTRVDL